MKYLKLSLLIMVNLFTIQSFSQIRVQALDKTTEEIIPFVKVFPTGGQPFLSDLDGRFVINQGVESFRLVYSGFKDSIYQVVAIEKGTVMMELTFQNLQEVVAVAGENPAHRIMDLVIANRKKNSPMDNGSFRYNSYSKFIMEIDPSVLKDIPEDTEDSSLISIRDFVSTTHLFMTETSSIRTFVPPSRDNEEVTAYKVSGFNDPTFATLSQELQGFSFYENQFLLNNKAYINPIALGGTRRYLFLLKDTTINKQDTVFHIEFRPRKGKNFDGLKGTLYINTNGYAIERVVAEPAITSSSFAVRIIQEYAFINNERWFPNKLSSEVEMTNVSLTIGDSDIRVFGKSISYVDNVEFDLEGVKRKIFNNAALVIDEEAGNKQEQEWDTLRKYELTDQENNTYVFIDSVVKEQNLDRALYAMKVLSTGKIPLGKFNSDLSRIIGFNNYEGFKLGMGLETSDKLFKPASLGGYFSYGFGDKAFKYGGNLDIFLFRPMQAKLRMTLSSDLLERGSVQSFGKTLSFSDPERTQIIYASFMDREEKAQVDLEGYVTNNFFLAAFGNYRMINLYDGHGYNSFSNNQNDGTAVVIQSDRLFVAEAGAYVKWTLFDEVKVIEGNRISLGSKYPTLKFSMSKSLPQFGNLDLTDGIDYIRTNIEMTQKISFRGIGVFQYTAGYAALSGNAPVSFAQSFLSSYTKDFRLNLVVPRTFETFAIGRNYFKEQATLITRFNFNTIRSWSKSFTPQFSLHHAFGMGRKYDGGSFGYPVPLVEQNQTEYYEAGFLLNNLLNSGFSSIGFGLFANYGPGALPQFEKNLVFKLSMTTSF
ncbi:MAG: hypothetical protein ACI9G9_000515 [Psychromonas sp.]|jgi:hypothetical protein